MKTLFEWWIDAWNKPAMQRSASDEIGMWLLPLVVVAIIFIVIIIIDAIVASHKNNDK